MLTASPIPILGQLGCVAQQTVMTFAGAVGVAESVGLTVWVFIASGVLALTRGRFGAAVSC